MTFASINGVSVGEILGRISRDLSSLFAAEIELAKREVRSDIRSAMRTAIAASAAVLSGFLLLFFSSVAIMLGLAMLMPMGWAALVVAGIWAVASAILISRALAMSKKISGAPRARETLKEDRAWIRTVKP
jgi:predicted RND superfamily exporter protein